MTFATEKKTCYSEIPGIKITSGSVMKLAYPKRRGIEPLCLIFNVFSAIKGTLSFFLIDFTVHSSG